MNLHAWITIQVDLAESSAHRAEPLFTADALDNLDDKLSVHILLNAPATVLRRCEADRRVLDLHHGCGNNCRVLIDLARTLGITDCELAELG